MVARRLSSSGLMRKPVLALSAAARAATPSAQAALQAGTQAGRMAVASARAQAGVGAPGAISACVHSLIGSALAGWWRTRAPDGEGD